VKLKVTKRKLMGTKTEEKLKWKEAVEQRKSDEQSSNPFCQKN